MSTQRERLAYLQRPDAVIGDESQPAFRKLVRYAVTWFEGTEPVTEVLARAVRNEAIGEALLAKTVMQLAGRGHEFGESALSERYALLQACRLSEDIAVKPAASID